jgi:protease-4
MNDRPDAPDDKEIDSAADTPSAEPEAQKKADPWTSSSTKESQHAQASTQADKTVAASDIKSGLNSEQETDSQWQHNLINRLAFASLNEQRRTRRWNVFFKSLFFVYLFIILILYMPDDSAELSMGKHTALIELKGVIADDAFASADTIVSGLRAAFKDKNTKGVILRINSPGGSPVQAGYINDEIYRLKEKYPDIPVYAVVVDLAASAAYYIAVAADEIYADKGSLVGSIGVLSGGFGFVDTMKKLGVERRLMTAGENKAMLDPFAPVNPKHQKHMQGLLDEVHQQFIDVVKKGRGDRLKENPDIFSGLFWNGESSVDLGLVDGLASSSQVARDIVGVEKIVDFTPRPNYFDQFAEKIGASIANQFEAMLKAPELQ